MFLRLFLCILLFSVGASAQLPRNRPHEEKQSLVKFAVSPDLFTIAVARSGNTAIKRYGRIELWNSATGKLQRTITGFDGPIWSLNFSADGKTLVTLSTEHRAQKVPTKVRDQREDVLAELKWWNAESGEFIRRVSLEVERGLISVQATWSPNGDVLALVERYAVSQLIASQQGIVDGRIMGPGFETLREVNLKLLDAQTGARRVKLEDASRSLTGYQGLVYARLDHPTFSADGKILAAALGTEVILWNAATGKKALTLKKVNGVPAAIAFSPDNRLVAVASTTSTRWKVESELAVWEVQSGKEVNRLKGRNDEMSSLQFAFEGRALLIGTLQYEAEGSTGTVKMWNLHENRLGRLNVRDGKPVWALMLLADQSVVLHLGDDVELWDAKTWEAKYTFEPSEEDEAETNRRSRLLLSAKQAVAVAFSRDGLTVSAEIPGDGLRRWDSRTGGVTEKAENDRATDAAVAMSANGDFRAADTGKGVRVENLVKGSSEEIKFSGDGPISALALSREGELLAVAGDKEITVLQVSGQAPAITLRADQEITALALDPAGQLLAVAHADRSIAFWNLRTRSMQGDLRKHGDVINALAFSPDGRMLASGGDDRTAILWEVATGKAKRTLKGHDVTVTSLAFSPDGRLLASGSGNAAVVLWDVASGKLDRILR